MTVQEYIDNDLPFYHITPSFNLENILKSGIKAGHCKAICVVRSNDPKIWREIINGQLAFEEHFYAIIKLSPKKHEIVSSEVAPDSADKNGTGPLHNYIDKPCIKVDESDAINRKFPKGERPNWDDICHMVEKLEKYHHKPIPDDSILEDLEDNMY